MASRLELTSKQLSLLSTVARDSLPNESCAFLLGNSNEARVVEILQMPNASRSPYSFSIEPKELLDAYDTAEKKGLQVIGIFHSHPGKPSPSPTDLKYMEINPVVWLIYSSTDQKFAAYIFDGKELKVEMVVKD